MAIEERLTIKAGRVLEAQSRWYNQKGKSAGVFKTGGWGGSSEEGKDSITLPSEAPLGIGGFTKGKGYL